MSKLENMYLMVRVGTLAMTLSLAAGAQTPEQRSRWQNDVAALGSHMVQEAKTTAADLARMTPEMMKAYAAHARAEEAQLSALAVKLGKPAPDWTAADAALETIIQKEKACRVDAACLANRQAAALSTQLCGHLGAIRVLTQRIATEKANPSGVVDLADLHSSGEDIQIHREQLAQGKAEYSKVTGKVFDAAVCK